MKKFLFPTLTMMALCGSLSAKVLDLGVTAGMNITKAEATDENSIYGWTPDSNNGWYAGLQFKFTLPLLGLGVDAAVTYSENEATLKLSDHKIDQKIGFITVPVHLRWDINLPLVDQGFAPFVFTGPQASYSVQKLEDELDTQYRDIKFDTNSLIFKWDVGAGVILGTHFQVSYAYEFPLTNTTTFEDAASHIKEDYKEGTHRIGLTYFF